MRIDLVTRYLTTSIERLELVRRHLSGDIVQESSTENPTTFKKHGESTFELIQSQLQVLQNQINLIDEELKNLQQKQQS